jgi:hypothetical protein
MTERRKMRSEDLNEENGWKAMFYEASGELYEGYLFIDAEDAMESARAFCQQMSPTERTQLLAVNSKRIIVGASDSKEYVVVLPPTKIQNNIKMNLGGENA